MVCRRLAMCVHCGFSLCPKSPTMKERNSPTALASTFSDTLGTFRCWPLVSGLAALGN